MAPNSTCSGLEAPTALIPRQSLCWHVHPAQQPNLQVHWTFTPCKEVKVPCRTRSSVCSSDERNTQMWSGDKRTPSHIKSPGKPDLTARTNRCGHSTGSEQNPKRAQAADTDIGLPSHAIYPRPTIKHLYRGRSCPKQAWWKLQM